MMFGLCFKSALYALLAVSIDHPVDSAMKTSVTIECSNRPGKSRCRLCRGCLTDGMVNLEGKCEPEPSTACRWYTPRGDPIDAISSAA